MKSTKNIKTGILCSELELGNNHIDMAGAAAEESLKEIGADLKGILRIKLALEEVLLKYQEAFGEKAAFSLRSVKRLGRLRLELSVKGERLDPFDTGEEMDSEVLRGILSGMGAAPMWQYKNGVNLITFLAKKKKRSQMVSLGIAIVLALAGGGLCRLLSGNVRTFLSEELIGPVFNSFMGLLAAIAGPMIFLSVAWGIYSIGDTATLGKVGKKMIGRFLLMSVILGVLSCGAVLPFFSVSSGGGGSFAFSELFQMILDIVPGNLLAPFVEGNPLQIIFVAVLIGMAMLILGNKTTVVAAFLEQSNSIVQLIMEGISSLVPLFVFGSIFKMMLSNDFSVLFQTYKLLPVFLFSSLVLLLIYIILVCVRKKVRMKTLLEKMMPGFLIALTTASSAAAFSVNIECCEKKLGIDKRIVNLGVPLGQVIFMPGAAVTFLVLGLCMAETYDVAITPAWLVTALMITIVLGIAAPPIPGGSLTCFTILYTQLDIPLDAVAVTIAFSIFLEFVATAVNLFCLQAELVELAGTLGMLDTKTLRGEKG